MTKQAVLQTLETLIAPGKRSRLSPFVESAQLSVLFGQFPNEAKRAESIEDILRQNDEQIEGIARCWVEFAQGGRDFQRQDYLGKDFRDAYLAYYFSANVCKIQLVLLDLVREDQLQGQLNLLDIGVGTGTTAIAVLDFLLVWGQICDLYGQPFPVTGVSLAGIDSSEGSLEHASSVVKAYAEALRRKLTSREAALQRERQTRNPGILEYVHAWAISAIWHLGNLEVQDELTFDYEPNLIVAANIWNELQEPGKANFDALLHQLPSEAIVIVIEPGSQRAATALMSWRRTFCHQSGSFIALAPCGQEFGTELSKVCISCWNARRESFHQPAVYKRFRQKCNEYFQDHRTFDQYENNLLSWSYVILAKQPSAKENPTFQNLEENQKISEMELCYIGSYWKQGKQENVNDTDSANESTSNSYEYMQVCPAAFDSNLPKVAIKLELGFQAPPLRYGQRFTISKFKARTDNICTLEPVLDQRGYVSSIHTSPSAIEENGLVTTFLPSYQDHVRQTINELAYRLFGFSGMRNFQHKILQRVLTNSGRNHILAIAATGGGKSECFILPAMLLPGITIAISPLKSLMLDQYEQRIKRRYGLEGLVTYINGDISFEERQNRLKKLELGYYKLVYFTPEQLERGWILDHLRRANQNLGVRYLAIDEAHCISQWGHDFRPAYLNIVHRLRSYGIEPKCIALTATASTEVRQDICDELGLDHRPLEAGGDVFIESSNRPELNLIVKVLPNTGEKVDAIVQDLQSCLANKSGSAVVFMPWTGGDPDKVDLSNRGPLVGKSSARVVHFAAFLEKELQQHNLVHIYHGKMDDDELETSFGEESARALGDMQGRTRQNQQNSFIDSDQAIMVATKGFGMGIDKADIRLVIHRTPPTNLEAYAQEAGRAGRDGQVANAILYYSPDRPIEDSEEANARIGRSDHEIQRFFLSEKYIRREDVIVMRAFLRTVTSKINGFLYFDSDAAIGFFNQCTRAEQVTGVSTNYQWPQRTNDRKSKTDYINRILQVLYRIRPTLDQEIHIAFLEQVFETGTNIRQPQVINAEAILNSNAYFGEYLRAFDLGGQELEQLLSAGKLLPIAQRLQLSLHETASLLMDIRSAKGLLKFQKIVAARPDGRGYGRGWEVLVGEAFIDDQHFDQYLEVFMNLHDSRKENDWAAYRRLLTDYIGVEEDGTARSWKTPKNCLRAVMLGYLKSYEVISGGKCLSCNCCVPDENFGQYTLKQRRQVVVRLHPEIEELLNQAESFAEAFPPDILLDQLFAAIQQEETEGRSLIQYVEGWSGRLLQDTPDHRAAFLIRLRAMIEGMFELQPQEFVTNAKRLVRLTIDVDITEVVWLLMSKAHELLPNEPEIYRLQIQLCDRFVLPHGKEQSIQRLIAILEDDLANRTELVELYSHLQNLYAPTGALADTSRYQDACIRLARLQNDASKAMKGYIAVMPSWQWEEVVQEIQLCRTTANEPAAVGVLCAWVKQAKSQVMQQRPEQVTQYLTTTGWSMLGEITPTNLALIVSLIVASPFAICPQLAARFANSLLIHQSEVSKSTIELALTALIEGESLAEEAIRKVIPLVLHQIDSLAIDRENLQLIFPRLIGSFVPRTPIELEKWLWLFPIELYHEVASHVIIQLLQATCQIRGQIAPVVLNRLEKVMLILLKREEVERAAHESWLTLCKRFSRSLKCYIDHCISSQSPKNEWAETAFDALLEKEDIRIYREELEAYLQSVYAQQAREFPRRIALCAEFFSIMQSYIIEQGGLQRPTGESLHTLRRCFNLQNSAEGADMFVVAIDFLSNQFRLTSSWMTPTALKMEALCIACRFTEAYELADQYPLLTVGRNREPCREYIERKQQLRESRNVGSEILNYKRIVQIYFLR